MSIDIFLQQAIIFHNQGNFNEAENLYKKCLALAPNNDGILNLLGLIAQSKGLDLIAIDYFYKALAINPFNQEYNFSLAYSLDNLKRYSEAINHYQKATAVKEALNNIANIYKKLGKITEAKNYYNKALKLDAEYKEPQINLAFLDQDIDNLKTFDDDYAKYLLALIYFEQKDTLKARQYLDNITEHTNQSYNLLGQISFYNSDYNNATIWFNKALQENPNDAQATLFIADILTTNKEYNKAQELYIKIKEDNINAQINYANMLFLSGEDVQSLEEYRKIIAKNQATFEVYNNLGIILKNQDEYQEALGLFLTALKLNPESEDASINILETIILFSQIKLLDAKKIANNWLKSYPQNIFAKHLSGRFEGKTSENDILLNSTLFDAFSSNYDDILAKIDYQLPKIVQNTFPNIKGRVLDLGCGSGQLANLIKTDKNSIIGIDLSQKMLDLSQKTQKYDNLIKSDALSFLSKDNNFDYIFALDVFCYINDLKEIINLIKHSKFFFSIELGKKEEIQINGRYQHSKKYIENLLKDTDYQSKELVLRKEADKNVNGMIFYKK